MNSVNKTLYIPLFGKAYVSRRGIILKDSRAEKIWSEAGFSLKGKSASKWLAFYMGMRSAVFDRWVSGRAKTSPEAVVLHIGCGLDSRAERVNAPCRWYDVDFPEVIAERRRWFEESESYRMLAADARESGWLEQLPRDHAIVVMEGVSMYFRPEELTALLEALAGHFARVELLADFYTTLAAKASKHRNPINDVGVTTVYGMDDPRTLENAAGLRYVREHSMTPPDMINQLHGMEKSVFRRVYSGSVARKMYRMYEFGKN